MKVYRCYIIWDDLRVMLILPTILFLASFVTYIVQLVAVNLHAANWTSSTVSHLFIISWSFSTAVEITTALIISSRLVYHRLQLKTTLDNKSLRKYVTVPAILLECAAIYAAAGIATIVCVIVETEWLGIFLPVFGLVQVSFAELHSG